MQIIQNIVQDLINTDKPLTASLYKGKFLARRIGNEAFLEWINNELNGYNNSVDPEEENVPDYRKHGAILIGSGYIGYHPYNDIPIITAGLEEGLIKSLQTVILYDSVSVLEKMSNDVKLDTLEINYPPELCAIIQSNVKKINPHFWLSTAKSITSSTFIVQCLTEIRSKFLDFMMELDEQFGGITNTDELIDTLRACWEIIFGETIKSAVA